MNFISKKRIRKFLYGIAMAAMMLFLWLGMSGSPAVLAQAADTPTPTETVVTPKTTNTIPPNSAYFTSTEVKLKDGQIVEKIIINGPPQPPAGYDRPTVSLSDSALPTGVVSLTVPAFDWSFGCSATSASMIAAYYDRNGYPNMYSGPTNGGVMPMNSSSWPNWTDTTGATWAQCPLTASRSGLDGRTTRGSIDDYWYKLNSSVQDPFITNGWTEHTYGDAIGDYMWTSQSNYGYKDGGTGFVWFLNGTPLPCSTMISNGFTDGTLGRELFYQARGYTVTDCYNQLTDNNKGGGFTFAMYKAEIDAGRPVLLNLVGHSIVGIGYDSSTNTVYLHDTWDYLTHTMPWGGSYGGMALEAVSVVNLAAMNGGTIRYAKPAASGSGNCSSWANACTLQTALTGAASGNEIWVMAGTHKPTTGTDRTATFQLKTGVAIYGGFAGTETARTQRNPAINTTILSGDIDSNDSANPVTDVSQIVGSNSYHVVSDSGTGGSAILDGFTITAGSADTSPYPSNAGAGLYNTGSPTLNNVTFSGNKSIGAGGGIFTYDGGPNITNANFNNNSASEGAGIYTTSDASAAGSPVLANVNFNSNTATSAGGGMYNNSGGPALTNVTFSNNSAPSGAGIYNYSSRPVLTNVTFSNNSAQYGAGLENNSSSPKVTGGSFSGNSATNNGGGMLNGGTNSDPVLTNVTFYNNSAGNIGGGMYNYYASPTLANITFSNNSAISGGGIYNFSSSPTLKNSTFTSNKGASNGNGGGMENDTSSNPTLTNVTFSGNSAAFGGGMYNQEYSDPQIRNTIFWDNTANVAGNQVDNGNINSIPNLSYSVVQGGCPAGSTCTNIISTDPMLGTLGNYGGLTQTIPVLVGSSAIDTGNDAVCPPTDQRGVTRPQGPHCDIGAFELARFTIKGNTEVGGATLTYTGGSTGADGSGNYTITVYSGWTGTITPSLTGYTFSPTSITYHNVVANQTAQNYTALVTITGNAGDKGVVLHYSINGAAKTVTSASNGRYTITVPYYWSGTVTPSKTDITFNPGSRTYTKITANPVAQNYTDTIIFKTSGAYNGWILESAKGSGVGGSLNSSSTTFSLGDDASNRQYRAILSFNTASLPDAATISTAVLKIKQNGSVTGTNPFSILGSLYADIRKGFFGTLPSLQVTDFNATASATKVATFGRTPAGDWYTATLLSAGRSGINKTSLTQFRLYFSTATNANNKADFMKFLSGNSSSNPAQLIITYTLP